MVCVKRYYDFQKIINNNIRRQKNKKINKKRRQKTSKDVKIKRVAVSYQYSFLEMFDLNHIAHSHHMSNAFVEFHKMLQVVHWKWVSSIQYVLNLLLSPKRKKKKEEKKRRKKGEKRRIEKYKQ